MTEQAPNPAQPTESTLALSFLREGIQDLRQDVRQIHERIDQTNGRIDDLRTEMSQLINQTNGRIDDLRTETNERINDLAKQLDSRYARLMAMLIACTSILVTTMGAAVAVLK
jgi:peptidoglycan hydrolase CwlO-like protein